MPELPDVTVYVERLVWELADGLLVVLHRMTAAATIEPTRAATATA